MAEGSLLEPRKSVKERIGQFELLNNSKTDRPPSTTNIAAKKLCDDTVSTKSPRQRQQQHDTSAELSNVPSNNRIGTKEVVMADDFILQPSTNVKEQIPQLELINDSNSEKPPSKSNIAVKKNCKTTSAINLTSPQKTSLSTETLSLGKGDLPQNKKILTDSSTYPSVKNASVDNDQTTKKNEDPPSKNVFRNFEKRSGTVDAGKEYEKLMCGLYALKLSLRKDVVDFEMTSNNAKCGDFDDIEIKVFFKNGIERRFMFQLKHKDNIQVLKKEHFIAKKHDFSTQKYFKSISEIQGHLENDVFILYTNNKVDLKNNKVDLKNNKVDLTTEIEAGHCDLEYEDLLLNTSKTSKDTVLQFTSKTNKTIKFCLFTEQYNAVKVESKLKEMLNDLLKCDIYGSLAHYLNKWWSQNCILTKHDFIAKLTELAFSPFISCVSNIKANEKTESLKHAIRKFDLTIVENGEENFIKNIWNVEQNEELFKTCKRNFVLANSDEPTISKILWYLEKTPLIVRVDHKNQTTIDSVLKLWEQELRRKSFILIGKVAREDFKEWNVFENLGDLKIKSIPEDIYFQIIENFKVSLQSRSEISLRQLIQIDEDMSQNIKTNELFQMAAEECYVIDPKQKEIPEFHISRGFFFSQSKKCVKENEIFDNVENNLNVFCAPAGMGKSRMMHVLSHNYCPSDCWAFYISLINCNQFFAKDEEDNTNDEEEIAKIMETFLKLDTEENCEKLMTKQIKKILVKRKKVHIFLDGLDEVDSKHVELVIKCAHHMIKKGLNVWISSRENLREILRQNFKFEPIEIQELDENQQENYIRQKLQSKYKESELEEIIKALFKSVGVNNSQPLFGIPLQLHIVTEIFLYNKDAYEKVQEQDLFVLTRMYKFFFKSKILNKFGKLGINKNLSSQLGTNFKNELKQYEIPALLSCLSKNDVRKLKLNKTENQSFLSGIKAQGDKNGIIKVVDQRGNAIFEHQTFAEYFACVWLKKNRENVVLLKNSFFNPRYDNLRKIFDIMMAENNPLHLAVIYQNQENIETHLSTFDEKDEGGRSAFHLACSYGNHQSSDLFLHKDSVKRETNLYKNIIDLLAEISKDLLQQRDHLFQFDCVDYSINRGGLYPLEKLVEKNLLTFEEINERMKLSFFQLRNFAIYLSLVGYSNLLIKLLELKPQLATENLSFLDDNVYLLHMAIKGCMKDDCTKPREENIRSVKFILNHTKDINDMYLTEQDLRFNPMDYACNNGCYDMIEILMQKGAKCSGGNTILHQISRKQEINENVIKMVNKNNVNINARNNEGQSALHLASENGSFGSVEILLTHGVDATIKDDMGNTPLHCLMQTEKENIDLLKLLIASGVHVNAQNKKGQKALHLANERGFFKSAKILLENDLDVTIKDDMSNTPLHFLMQGRNENTDMVKVLITSGVNVNAHNKQGQNALHLASKRGFLDSAKILLENDADVTIKDDMGNTPLHFLMQSQHENTDMAKLLITSGVNILAQNNEGENALHLASKRGFLESTKILLENKVDVTIRDRMNNTPLHCLMQYWTENSEMVKLLTTNGVDVNAQNKEGQNALHLAIERSFFKSAKILLETGVNVAIKDGMDNTPLHCLLQSERENTDIVTLLITSGVNINAQNKESQNALHLAIERGFLDSAEILLENKVDVTIKDDMGNSPLHCLMLNEEEDTDMVKLLVTSGAHVNAQNKEGKNALHLAIERGFLDSAEILLENKVDVTIKDDMGNSPLHSLMQNEEEDIDMVKLLITSGVHINAQNKEGKNALHLAIERGFLESADFLLENEVDVNIKDNKNNTSLHYLMQHWTENSEMVKLLITKGVDVNAQNKEGKTALHLALERGFLESGDFLLENGVDATINDDMGNTPLHYLMQNEIENTYMMKLLIMSGVNLHVQNKKGQNALHFAIKRGFLKSVKILLNNQVDVTIKDDMDNTPLHFLMQGRNESTEMVKLLITNGVSVHAQNKEGQNALHLAFKKGFYESAKIFLENKVDVTIKDDMGNTPLHFLIQGWTDCPDVVELLKQLRLDYNVPNESTEMVKLLITSGVNVNAQNKEGQNALHLAIQKGFFESAKILLENKLNVTIKDDMDNTPLHCLLLSGKENTDLMNLLIAKGVDVDAQNKKGKTAFHLAIEKNFLKSANILLSSGTDVMIVDETESTGLHYLMNIRNNVCKLAESLIQKGLHPNLLNKFGQTPSHIACRIGCFENVEFLHRHNADFTVVDNNGYMSLHYASMCKHENVEVIDFLLRQDIEINARNGNGNTPIHSTCSFGCIQNVQYLHRQNADLTIADNDGDTLLHNASQSKDNNIPIIDFLLQQNLDINALNKKGQTPLLAACEQGHLKNVNFLCEQELDLTIRDNDGKTVIDYLQKLEDSDDKESLHYYFKENGLKLNLSRKH